jgi:hypothetical protein
MSKSVMFFFSSFLFRKIREQEDRRGPAQGRGMAAVKGGIWWGKGIGE